ncbi:MAG: hypothetical protein PHI85_05840 [Victivallaceae bacterium]|nr:hypothetical protein [Victivallaceae bacterium]
MSDLLDNAADRAAAEAVRKVADLVKCAGGNAYLVGGAVRDALTGTPSHDLDVEVFGLSPDRLTAALETEFKLNLVGSSFGVVKLSGVDVDVAIPRRENKTGTGHRGFLMDFDPSLTLSEAAARRDFTVNAIMYDLSAGKIEDPHDGQRDLRAGVLRQVGGHFSEDPLRVLRAMQFLARFRFVPAPELVAECRKMTPENLPVERVGEEWKKLLLKGAEPSLGLNFLRVSGWVDFYPELKYLIGCEQYRKWHPEGDVWTHTLHCLDAAATMRCAAADRDNLIFMLSVLCHDFGKPSTTVFEPDGRITSKGHEESGSAPAGRFLTRLFRDASIARDVLPLVENHLKPYSYFYNHAGDRAFRHLAVRVARCDLLAKVALADSAGRPPLPPDREPIEWFNKKIRELEIAAGAPKPLIMGRHVLALGVPPGPEVGRLTAACYQAQLDGEFSTLPDALLRLETLVNAIKP